MGVLPKWVRKLVVNDVWLWMPTARAMRATVQSVVRRSRAGPLEAPGEEVLVGRLAERLRGTRG